MWIQYKNNINFLKLLTWKKSVFPYRLAIITLRQSKTLIQNRFSGEKEKRNFNFFRSENVKQSLYYYTYLIYFLKFHLCVFIYSRNVSLVNSDFRVYLLFIYLFAKLFNYIFTFSINIILQQQNLNKYCQFIILFHRFRIEITSATYNLLCFVADQSFLFPHLKYQSPIVFSLIYSEPFYNSILRPSICS